MIVGIGIDTIEIERFAHWHIFKKNQLLRIFSENEIFYCLDISAKSAERFAVRFAAKEACYKALCAYVRKKEHSFLMCAKSIEVINKREMPELVINWKELKFIDIAQNITMHVSLSHNKIYATALVILEKVG